MTVFKKIQGLNYTEEELERDSPYNQWLYQETFEEEKKMKPLVIYHGNCADGFGAAWVFHSIQEQMGVEFDFHAGVYSKPPPDVKDRVVYLVDFSYKKEVVEKMLEDAFSITLIDHHKTAIGDLAPIDNKKFFRYVDLERSGAMLAWDYWHNSDFRVCYNKPEWDICSYSETKKGMPGYVMPPLLLEHIQDRDLWKFSLPNTKEIMASVFSTDYTFEVWDILMSNSVTSMLNLTVAGSAILRKHNKDLIAVKEEGKHMRQIGAYVVPVCNAPYYMASDLGEMLAKEYENGTYFSAVYHDTPDGRKFSLRSVKGVGMDVSLIAQHYGGGGHKNAAGFSVPFNHPLANRVTMVFPEPLGKTKVQTREQIAGSDF